MEISAALGAVWLVEDFIIFLLISHLSLVCITSLLARNDATYYFCAKLYVWFLYAIFHEQIKILNAHYMSIYE